MENNNSQEFNMDKYNDFLSKIKAGSPVHKINFTLESPNAIVGMYLITMKDVESYLDKFVDHSDLNEDTLLVFESRHVVECCQIIYGCLNILKGIGMVKKEYKLIIGDIIKKSLSFPTFYSTFKKSMLDVNFTAIENSDYEEWKIVYKKFVYILQNIWFVPYGKIDEMAKEAIEEFKKHCEEGENNE